MLKLFLDDERFPPDDGSEWVIVRSAFEAMLYCMDHGCPEFISFDHDLGENDTGMNFVHGLVHYDLDHPGFIPDNFEFYVHSQNVEGKKNIEGLLNSYLSFRLANPN
jgi:hypothetical protein